MIYFNHSAKRMTEQSTFVLLYQLRNRLRMINERIAERQKQSEYSYEHRVFTDGAITELQDEALFLAGMIADIEAEAQSC